LALLKYPFYPLFILDNGTTPVKMNEQKGVCNVAHAKGGWRFAEYICAQSKDKCQKKYIIYYAQSKGLLHRKDTSLLHREDTLRAKARRNKLHSYIRGLFLED